MKAHNPLFDDGARQDEPVLSGYISNLPKKKMVRIHLNSIASLLQRNKTVEVARLAACGEFEPLALLVRKKILDPKAVILDPEVGTKLVHYAAHHGDLKFLRYLLETENAFEEEGLSMMNSSENEDKTNFDDPDTATSRSLVHDLDFFDCNLLHYAVRSGQLPILMYCADVLQVDLEQRDRFGNSLLDFSIIHRRLYCFIFLYFSKGMRTFDDEKLSMLMASLCKSQKKGLSEPNSAMNLVKILLRLPEVRPLVGPILLIEAIKHGQVQIVQEVYEQCYFFPRHILKEKPIILWSRIKQVIEQLPNMDHLKLKDKQFIMAILDGTVSRKCFGNPKHSMLRKLNPCKLFNLWISFLFVVVMGGLLAWSTTIGQPKWRIEELRQQGLKNHNRTFSNEEVVQIEEQRDQVVEANWAMILYDNLIAEYLYIDTQQDQFILFVSAQRVAFFALSFLMLWLFLAAQVPTTIYGQPTQLGSGLQRLGESMSSFSSGDLDKILVKFEELCFSCFLQKRTNDVEHCSFAGRCVVQYHGFSHFLDRPLHKGNFRQYFLTHVFILCFLGANILHVLVRQRVLFLVSSSVFRVIEIHLFGIINMFKSRQEFSFGFFLLLSEILFVLQLQLTFRMVFAISHKLTLRELSKPHVYCWKRLGLSFKLKKLEYLNKQSGRRRLEFQTVLAYEPSLLQMIWNIFIFSLTGHLRREIKGGEHDDEDEDSPQRGVALEFGDEPEESNFISSSLRKPSRAASLYPPGFTLASSNDDEEEREPLDLSFNSERPPPSRCDDIEMQALTANDSPQSP